MSERTSRRTEATTTARARRGRTASASTSRRSGRSTRSRRQIDEARHARDARSASASAAAAARASLRHRVPRRRAARARPRARVRRRPTASTVRVVCRQEEPPLPRRLDARLGADAHAPGLQVQEPAREDALRLRALVHRLSARRLAMTDPFATLGLARALRPRPAARSRRRTASSRARSIRTATPARPRASARRAEQGRRRERGVAHRARPRSAGPRRCSRSRASPVGETASRRPTPELLMEMLELREELAEAERGKGPRRACASWPTAIEARSRRRRGVARPRGFAAGDPDVARVARRQLGELRFYPALPRRGERHRRRARPSLTAPWPCFEIFDPKAPPRPIGIDLGTTNSLVAYVRERAARTSSPTATASASCRASCTTTPTAASSSAGARCASPPSTRATRSSA